MKPVDKGVTITGFANHGDAKDQLIARLGQYCSYCERWKDPQDLHVEHIYSQDPHPGRARLWRNFLLACSTCNTYKHLYLKNNRQAWLLKRFLWPHIDNTFSAFDYDKEGIVTVALALPANKIPIASDTLALAGLWKSPVAAAPFQTLWIEYDTTRKRKGAWEDANSALELYQSQPMPNVLDHILRLAKKSGHFSIWMKVFNNYPDVRKKLIALFKASPQCFDVATTQPVSRGRI